MSHMSPMELSVAQLIVESLNLEIEPSEIAPDQPMYRDGLGLDSIDMLELSLVISKNFGFQIRSDDPDNASIFSSLRALSQTIETRRTK